MKKNYKIVLHLSIFFLAFTLFISCGIKTSEKTLILSLKEGEVYEGKTWWRLEIYNRKEENRVWGGYADFEVTTQYLYLLVRNFWGGNLAFFKWELRYPQEVCLYDFKGKRIYIFLFEELPNNQEIPFYFLGFKKKKDFKIESLILSYSFILPEKKGVLTSERFQIEWQIKTIKIKEKLGSLKEEVERLSSWEKIIIPYSSKDSSYGNKKSEDN